jgi:hypothetical protein
MTETTNTTATAETIETEGGYCREAKMDTKTWTATPCRHGNTLAHRIGDLLPESTDQL